jgi:hypothetical protein
MFRDHFSLAPLPDSKVPDRKRRLVLIGLVWFAGLALVATAQLELDSIEADAWNASSAQESAVHAPPAAQPEARPVE